MDCEKFIKIMPLWKVSWWTASQSFPGNSQHGFGPTLNILMVPNWMERRRRRNIRGGGKVEEESIKIGFHWAPNGNLILTENGPPTSFLNGDSLLGVCGHVIRMSKDAR